jgi:hypothetical protein
VASNAEYAAMLTPTQRWEVLFMYRRERLGAQVGGNFPIDAVIRARDTFARWCALEVLAGNAEWARVRARQCAYAKTLSASPVVRRVHTAILNQRAAPA